MSAIKEITLLAVTKMHGGVCVAGIDASGQWVRPVRPVKETSHYANVISDYCLLPVDFFHEGRSHLINMGVTQFHFKDYAPQPPHTEDWTLDLQKKPRFLKKLSLTEQEDFLRQHAEADLAVLQTDGQGERSLGLFTVEDFSFTFAPNKTGDDVTVRATFQIGTTAVQDIGCTDLRMRALGRKLLAKSNGVPRTLTQEDFRKQGKQATYLALGLSRLFQGKHWLIVVGAHTLPELQIEVDYARL